MSVISRIFNVKAIRVALRISRIRYICPAKTLNLALSKVRHSLANSWHNLT